MPAIVTADTKHIVRADIGRRIQRLVFWAAAARYTIAQAGTKGKIRHNARWPFLWEPPPHLKHIQRLRKAQQVG